MRPTYRDHVWSYDFTHHRTDDGRAFRTLNIIDEFSRECLEIRVKRNLNSTDAGDALTDLSILRGIPAVGIVTQLSFPGCIGGKQCKTGFENLRDGFIFGNLNPRLGLLLVLTYWFWQTRSHTVKKFSSSDYVECKRVAIELTSLCNRDCIFCQRFNDRSGVRKDEDGKAIIDEMPTEHVYSIIDQLAELEFKKTVLFHGFSEPTLDRRLPKFVAYAKEKDMKVRITTNGDVLKVNDQLCNELDGLVDVFKVSLYDYRTHKEKVELKKFWENRITKSRIKFGSAVEEHYHRNQSKLLPSELSNQTQAELPCLRTHGLYIRYDGEVGLCCLDDHRSFNLGNAFEDTLEDIWWSDRRIQIANNLKEPGGRKKYDYCVNCYFMPPKNFSFREKTTKRMRKLLFRFGLNAITEKGL